jgi:large subunit ribosomal protein L6
MSKIGKLPITIKDGINVTSDEKEVTITGPKGEMRFALPSGVGINIEDGTLVVTAQKSNDPNFSALSGLTRSVLASMIKGVESEFEKKLELSGVGYRAQVQGADLVLSLGFSHPVKIKPEQGIKFTVNENVITVTGVNKQLVGDTAAKIRAVRPPEPYKGKGIKYMGERIRRKAGKAAKAVGGK